MANTLSPGASVNPLGRPYAPVAAGTVSTATPASAVSWAAIVAGAAAAAALSLILLILGAGLGLSSVSPWAQRGVGAAAFGISAVLWLTFTQLAASGVGGYIAGRLRTRWADVQRDEVYFRDTAHGFLAWAVASLATAALLTSAIGSIVGSGVQAGAAVAGGAASTAAAAATAAGAGSAAASSDGAGSTLYYFVDSLFRPGATAAIDPVASTPAPAATDAGPARTREVARIFANSVRTGALPPEDARYVAQIVAQRTGLPLAEAERRINDAYTHLQAKAREAETAAREAADTARKTSAYASLWLFVSLLVGAFVASLAATWGGRQRDL
ncbi:MAG TPA: hypothetical protein VGC24_01315 [Burkholderiaceae bacterium]